MMPDLADHVRIPNTGALQLHFLHANGYPPQAYDVFLGQLAERFDVSAIESRPLWKEASPATVGDWGRLQQDLGDFLEQQAEGPWIGIGHSVGGTVTLMAALERPDLFQALAILDPPLFPPVYGRVWHWVIKAGFENRLHPLAPGALRRRRAFDSREAMFENYRSKNVFRKIDDRVLLDFVDSLAIPEDSGGVQLRYTPAWVAGIYTEGMLAVPKTWRLPPSLKVPVIYLRGEHNNAFYASTLQKIRHMIPAAKIIEMAGASHLFPLEIPQETAGLVTGFIEKSKLNSANVPVRARAAPPGAKVK
jgi:pimeloyl-ACP methyl ester carboxylesterase